MLDAVKDGMAPTLIAGFIHPGLMDLQTVGALLCECSQRRDLPAPRSWQRQDSRMRTCLRYSATAAQAGPGIFGLQGQLLRRPSDLAVLGAELEEIPGAMSCE